MEWEWDQGIERGVGGLVVMVGGTEGDDDVDVDRGTGVYVPPFPGLSGRAERTMSSQEWCCWWICSPLVVLPKLRRTCGVCACVCV